MLYGWTPLAMLAQEGRELNSPLIDIIRLQDPYIYLASDSSVSTTALRTTTSLTNQMKK